MNTQAAQLRDNIRQVLLEQMPADTRRLIYSSVVLEFVKLFPTSSALIAHLTDMIAKTGQYDVALGALLLTLDTYCLEQETAATIKQETAAFKEATKNILSKMK